jgi:hypothetical protein
MDDSMAKFLVGILMKDPKIPFSWGISSMQTIEDGLSFSVNGFKYSGVVKIIYDHLEDLFNVDFVKDNKVVYGVFVGTLVSVIDDYVERGGDNSDEYRARVIEYYKKNGII